MSHKADTSGLLLVGVAAVVLLFIVNRSTQAAATGVPTSAPSMYPAGSLQGLLGSNASSFLGNLLNAANTPITPIANTPIAQLWGNGVFQVGDQLTDPLQVSVNTDTGAVSESPFSGMYALLSPLDMGFTS
jgi:hypothetical protein